MATKMDQRWTATVIAITVPRDHYGSPFQTMLQDIRPMRSPSGVPDEGCWGAMLRPVAAHPPGGPPTKTWCFPARTRRVRGNKWAQQTATPGSRLWSGCSRRFRTLPRTGWYLTRCPLESFESRAYLTASRAQPARDAARHRHCRWPEATAEARRAGRPGIQGPEGIANGLYAEGRLTGEGAPS